MYFYSPYPTWNYPIYEQQPVPLYYPHPVTYSNPFQYYQQSLAYPSIIQSQKPQQFSPFNTFENQNQKQITQNHIDNSLKSDEELEINQNRKTQNQSSIFRQKEGRNVLSNIFRQFLRYFFYNKERTLELVGKIAKAKSFQINPKQFFATMTKKNASLKTYVRVQQIKSFIQKKSGDIKTDEFNQVFRILLMIHLKHNHTSAIYHSGKVPKGSRQLHFIFGRKLQEMLKN